MNIEGLEKNKKNLNQSRNLIKILAKIIGNGKDFPTLVSKSVDIKDIMNEIEEKSTTDDELCEKSCAYYDQIKNLLKDFAKQNNIKIEEE